MTVVEMSAGLNDEQLAAVEADGSVFVSAGAGTGKTSVLVERYVRAVCERGIDVESILVITYTRKAAGELRSRIRAALRERGRPDLARELDGAWISTIHGFCNRLLRAHPFAAGLDPRFRELEDAGAAVLRGEAFERALQEFCASGDAERMRLLATYRADGLRRMLTGVYETLRSAGRELVLELGERPESRQRTGRSSRRGGAARGRRVGDGDAAPECRRGASHRDRRLAAGTTRRPLGACLQRRACSVVRAGAQGSGARSARGARGARPRAPAGAARAFRRGVRGGEAARVGGRLRGPPAGGPRPASGRRRCSRGDAASLPDGDGRRVPGHEPAPVRAHRPRRTSRPHRGLHGRRRVPVDLRLPPRGSRGLPRASRSRRRACSRSHATTARDRRCSLR